MSTNDQKLSRSWEELMSGEDFAHLVHITGGVEAYCRITGDKPETVHANMQDGKIMYVLETPRLDPAEIRSLREELGMSQQRFDAYMGLPAGTIQKWENEPTGP